MERQAKQRLTKTRLSTICELQMFTSKYFLSLHSKAKDDVPTLTAHLMSFVKFEKKDYANKTNKSVLVSKIL